MANPLYNASQNNFSNIIQQAQELRRTITQDPKQIVQGLLNSGEMSQADFNRLMPVAQQIVAMMPHK
jgi:hypothetical protein